VTAALSESGKFGIGSRTFPDPMTVRNSRNFFFLSANFFYPNSKGTINFGVRAEYFHIFKVRDFQKDSSTDCSAFLIKSPFSFRMPVVCNPLSVIRGDESA